MENKMVETSFSNTKAQKVARSLSYGDASSSVSLEVTQGNCKVVIISSSGEYGDITLNYTLEDDREGTASIKPLYSTGGAFAEMTDAGGSSEGKRTLATSASGTSHVFIWDTVTDLGIDYKGKATVKIWAYDRDDLIGDYNEAPALPLTIDNAPEAPVISSPTTGFFDKNTTPSIEGNIPNPKAGNSNLHIKIEIGNDENFDSIESTFESVLDQTGWEYYTGAAWVAIPEAGIPIITTPALIGENWKFTLQTESELTEGQKFIRAYAGGVL